MSMSDSIEKLLLQMLRDSGGSVVIRRNTLAGKLNCVPSQINYVIRTRFTPERGYMIESRRGGGGGVRISSVSTDGDNYPMHLVNAIGAELSYRTAVVFIQNLLDYEYISEREAHLMLGAVSDSSLALPSSVRDGVRAVILKNMILNIFGR